MAHDDVTVYLFRDRSGDTYERITFHMSDRIQNGLSNGDRSIWRAVLALIDGYARDQSSDH